MLSTFSAARARAQDKAPFDELVNELQSSSEEFRRWWPQADVSGFDEGIKRLQHATQARVDLTYSPVA